MNLIWVAMITSVMIIGGVMLMMMTTTMTEPEVMMVMMVLEPLLLLDIQVCVLKFNLFACLITAFPKKSIMHLIINLL